MDDLSRVVSFLTRCREDVGNDGNTILGFRGPRGFDFEFSAAELARAGAADELDVGLTIIVVFWSERPDSDHSGHFFASSESSGTWTISLQGAMGILLRKGAPRGKRSQDILAREAIPLLNLD